MPLVVKANVPPPIASVAAEPTLPLKVSVPALTVNAPAKAFVAFERIRPEPALFSTMFVTAEAMIGALIVVVPVPVPELVIVPVLARLVVETVKVPVLFALMIRLPVPVVPPETVNAAVPVELSVVATLFTVIRPEIVSGLVLLASVIAA